MELLEVVSPCLEKLGNSEIGRTQMTIFYQVLALFSSCRKVRNQVLHLKKSYNQALQS